MAFDWSLLWKAPEINPINRKARSIPVLNPVNQYGRVFFFSWFGFLIAFWSWYAFPPLLTDIIAPDLHMTTAQVGNSNIIGLCATLLVRLIAGPACDWVGPRITFAATLLIGAIPTFLSGTAYTVNELYALRFFIGILGGSFVPCQVWTTAFFDKNIVGTANSLTGGWGNSGGGITYFVMPAIFYSLVGDGLSRDVAWRVAFVVPGILIVTAAVALLVLCPDTPTGKWADRMQSAENNLRAHGLEGAIVDVPAAVVGAEKTAETPSADGSNHSNDLHDEEKKLDATRGTLGEHEVQLGEQEMLSTARGEVIQKPTLREVLHVCFSPATIVVAACYFCTFGAELAINSNLGSYYKKTFPKQLDTSTSGDWAAMFGLMNIICRPLGGVVSDFVYRHTGKNPWSKKVVLHVYGVVTGAILLAVGLAHHRTIYSLTLLIGLGVSFFLEGANGMNFSLVPHVHPYANGVVSGFTGASGNLGGIVFSVIFRFNSYARSMWIIGTIIIAVNLAVCWIRPIPKGQIGGL